MLREFMPQSAARMADCLMQRYGLLTSRWSYDYGVAWRGMEALYALTGEKKVRDLWAKKDIGTAKDSVSAVIPPHGAKLYKLS